MVKPWNLDQLFQPKEEVCEVCQYRAGAHCTLSDTCTDLNSYCERFAPKTD